MKLADFDFHLPEHLIALRPAKPRPASRLLLAQGADIEDRHFYDLPTLLRPGDRLVLNDTKVIPARLNGQRRRWSAQGETFASIEISLLHPNGQGDWLALAKPGRRVRAGETITFCENLRAIVLEKGPEALTLRFSKSGVEFEAALLKCGTMPLPPYICRKRAADTRDMSDYQSVFAQKSGAVAAPTASLHFDQPTLDALGENGISVTKVTLHVGGGTFLPVKTQNIDAHTMHAEWGQVSQQAAQEIAQTRASGGRVIPVGTTSLRLIETAAQKTGKISPWTGDTEIFIRPGFEFAVADGLITNFHLPKSTLMMLVSALMGTQSIKNIYAHAIDGRYRFFSYGDSSLLLPQGR